jgi:spermidine/putrescine transport system permease protein
MVVVLLSFNSAQFGSFPIEGFSLRWFEELANNAAIVRALKTSLVLAILSSTISTTMGILASLALVRYDFPGKSWINTLLVAPVLIPETVLGVGLLLFMLWLSQPRSFPILLLGHVLISLPYVVLVVQARLIGVKRVYEEAAMSLGASRMQTFFAITFPLMLPAVIAGALFAFTISFDNITATVFWRPPGTETVPTQIYGMLRNSISPEINALGTVMIIITVGLPLVAGGVARYFARSRG